jgi:N-acetylneuraminic acid mutarotase
VYAEAAGDFWLSKTPLPILVKDSAAIAVDSEIFVMGYNYTSAGNSTVTHNAFNYAFDISNDSWTAKTPIPVLQVEFAMATYQNKIYLLGGWNAFPTGDAYYSKTNQAYDIENDRWEIKTALPWPRWGLQANVVEDKIYLIGGMLLQQNNAVSDINQVYDPITDTWTTLTPMPTPVYNYGSAVVDNKIYIIGGGRGGKNGTGLDLVQIYEPKTNNWTIGKSLPTPVGNVAAAVISNGLTITKICVLGITNEYFDINSTAITQIYDIPSDSWTMVASIPAPNYIDFSVVATKGTIYAMGGKPFGFTPGLFKAVNFQYFPPSTAEPTPSPTPNIPSSSPSLTIAPTLIPSSTTTASSAPTATIPTSPSPQLTQTPQPQQTDSSLDFVTIAEIAIAIIAVVVAASVVWRTRKQSK